MKKKDVENTYKGEWVTPDIKASACIIESRSGFFKRRKNGWQLQQTLIYCDKKYRLWVALPGYLWDGPSYPSADGSIVGKVLKVLVGYRKKKGLLASSAQHDQMAKPSRIIQFTPKKLEVLKKKIEKNIHNEYIAKQQYEEIDMSIREAAYLYKAMLTQWPDKEETIGNWKSFKQFLGLRLFQPWYRLITGPSVNKWVKVG